MHVTIDEAAAIYARACRAWYGQRAPQVVKKRMRELERRGDAGGAAAWAKVAAALDSGRSAHHRTANA
jgi:hypothetical protein